MQTKKTTMRTILWKFILSSFFLCVLSSQAFGYYDQSTTEDAFHEEPLQASAGYHKGNLYLQLYVDPVQYPSIEKITISLKSEEVKSYQSDSCIPYYDLNDFLFLDHDNDFRAKFTNFEILAKKRVYETGYLIIFNSFEEKTNKFTVQATLSVKKANGDLMEVVKELKLEEVSTNKKK